MNNSHWNEKWKDIGFPENISEKEKYRISNYGRVKSMKVDKEFGQLIKLFGVRGYLRIPLTQKNGKKTARYVHKLVAEAFLEKPSDKHKYVIHLDYDKENNHISNLQWATTFEKEQHQFKNPIYKGPRRVVSYSKLTEGRVKLIKKKIFDPNRKTRMKMIAKQFGISEMQLYRIKSGENWGHVTID